ncbi:hypothetical protein [Segetibacter sp.]|uniref:hypothetical protein n=1 Tax=Segetibacter sp. TaxID=2231182 RepID=UPI00260537CF|nr:hypothetical protein [Segetibacter sp.]MCW3079268.1 hypothetical protein [Segetibacter sp.]
MIKLIPLIFLVFLMGCSISPKKESPLIVKTILPKELKEISGITSVGDDLWVITDKPKSRVFKLSAQGRLLQIVNVSNVEATDVEAIASDATFIYLADVGDNMGDRVERKVIRIAIASIPAGEEVEITGETIEFTFPNEVVVESKKQNNYDCESMLSFKDSLYFFTKDREDKETKLYAIPKAPGKYAARYINTFNSEGLITDAALNKAGNELALLGYRKGHTFPFIYLFNDFRGENFFSGKHQKIELADKNWDWQLEGIAYGNNNNLYFSCEETKEVTATLYGINRSSLFKLAKQKKEKKKTKDKEETSEDERLKR